MRALAAVLVVGTTQVACTQGVSRVTSSTEPRGNPFLAAQLDRMGEPTDGVILLAIGNPDGTVDHTAVGDASSNTVGPDGAFRIGSVTKVFTAALVLSLVDDGVVSLDAPAADYVTRLPIPSDVTVRHLLAQRSGIPDYTFRPFLGDDQAGLARAWLPEELYPFVADESLMFEPGAEFAYGNSNFLVLGVLVEEVTGSPFHEALRARILDPVGLEATYLSHHEEGASPREAFTKLGQFGGSVVPVDFDYTSIATTVWAAGALVSTVDDLHAFFSALSAGEIISESLLSEMTTGSGIRGRRDPAGRYDYGLGVELFEAPGLVYGARGDLPGSITLVMHAPRTGETFVFSSSNDRFDFAAVLREAAGRLGG